MNLEAFILGCGGMMPLPYRHLTSVLVRREGDLFLFDCGEGTQVALRRLNLRWKRINAIFISHTHADHITGLPGLLMLSSQVDRDEPMYIFGPPKIAEYVEANRRVLDMYINYEIIIKEILAPGIIFSTDEFQVRAFWLDHTKPCLGYVMEEFERPGVFNPEAATALHVPCGPLWSKLQSGESVTASNGTLVAPEQVMGQKRKGRKFAFVTDTKYIPSIAQEVMGADFFVCEGMFEDGMEKDAAEKKHMTCTQAAKIAKDAGVKKMALIHYSPRYTDKELKILLEQACTVFPGTILSKDKMNIKLEYDD